MKIIKQGVKPSEVVYRATCRSCTTEVEFTHGEALYVTDERDGDYVEVTCPVCNKDISGYKSNIYTGK